jgi:hypothetical protein
MCWRVISLFIVLAVIATEARGEVVGPFTDARFRKYENGDLDASYTTQGDTVTMRVRSRTGMTPLDGFAGVCIENASSAVSLTNFTHARSRLQASAAVVIDVKLEKTRFAEGVFLLDGSKRLKPGDNQLRWEFRGKEDTSRNQDTLSQVKRLCVFVLADEFPSKVNEVVLTFGPIIFDR